MIFPLICLFTYSLFCESPAQDFPQEKLKLIGETLDLKKIMLKPSNPMLITPT